MDWLNWLLKTFLVIGAPTTVWLITWGGLYLSKEAACNVGYREYCVATKEKDIAEAMQILLDAYPDRDVILKQLK